MTDTPCRCCGSLTVHHRSPGRRRFTGGLMASGLLAAGMVASPRAARAADPIAKTSLTPEEALKLLQEGNDRFVTDAPFRSTQGRERRVELARGQAPFAVLVGCSDSR